MKIFGKSMENNSGLIDYCFSNLINDKMRKKFVHSLTIKRVIFILIINFGIHAENINFNLQPVEIYNIHFEEIYKYYKFPLAKSLHKEIATQFQSNDNEAMRLKYNQYTDRSNNCIGVKKKFYLYYSFHVFINFYHSLYFKSDIDVWGVCRKNSINWNEGHILGYKKMIFDSLKQVKFQFPSSIFSNRKVKKQAKACHEWMLETATHYMNLGSFHYSHLDLIKMNNDFASLQDILFSPEVVDSEIWNNWIEEKCTFFKRIYNFQKQLSYSSSYYKENLSKENSQLLVFFRERANFILSSPFISKTDSNILKNTLSCFENWPKPHYEVLVMDYYSGFFYNYSKEFFFKYHEKIDPNFQDVLDYYYKSLYQSELFSLRLKDMYSNCKRVSLIPSSEFTVEKIVAKFIEDKRLIENRKSSQDQTEFPEVIDGSLQYRNPKPGSSPIYKIIRPIEHNTPK